MVAVLAVAAAIASMFLVGCSGGAQSADNEIELVMLDSSFRPNVVTLGAGETVTFVLPNRGQLQHNMRIAALNGSYRTTWASVPALSNPATTGKLTWTAPAEPGRYRFRCDLHETTMTGTITVE